MTTPDDSIPMSQFLTDAQQELDEQTQRAIQRIAAATRNQYDALLAAFLELNGLGTLDDFIIPDEEDVARALARRIGVMSKDTPH